MSCKCRVCILCACVRVCFPKSRVKEASECWVTRAKGINTTQNNNIQSSDDVRAEVEGVIKTAHWTWSQNASILAHCSRTQIVPNDCVQLCAWIFLCKTFGLVSRGPQNIKGWTQFFCGSIQEYILVVDCCIWHSSISRRIAGSLANKQRSLPVNVCLRFFSSRSALYVNNVAETYRRVGFTGNQIDKQQTQFVGNILHSGLVVTCRKRKGCWWGRRQQPREEDPG